MRTLAHAAGRTTEDRDVGLVGLAQPAAVADEGGGRVLTKAGFVPI